MVAEVDGSIMGFVDVSISRPDVSGTMHRRMAEGAVELLAVTRPARGRGIGRALMAAAEDAVLERGGRAVFLDTHITNEEARAFYGKMGYREAGVIFIKEL